ncbi:hypothetical protein ACIBQ1_38115 [Nonomuraea sp. NPDC050153]|uniref:hypothetical protein n=1 Tax=Nonomuraea sp. NPDC050153 TaxID=3364359 RepID=UPI0037876479
MAIATSGALSVLAPTTASATSCQTSKSDGANTAYAKCLGTDFRYYYAWATCLENDGNLYFSRGNNVYIENGVSAASCHEYADVDAYGVEVIPR